MTARCIYAGHIFVVDVASLHEIVKSLWPSVHSTMHSARWRVGHIIKWEKLLFPPVPIAGNLWLSKSLRAVEKPGEWFLYLYLCVMKKNCGYQLLWKQADYYVWKNWDEYFENCTTRGLPLLGSTQSEWMTVKPAVDAMVFDVLSRKTEVENFLAWWSEILAI